MSLLLLAMIQSLLLSTVFSQGTCKETSDVRFTFYGMPDGGDTTAFSCGDDGGKAGGIGSYTDPVTFATSKSNTAFSKCDIVYLPYFQKYFQMSDYCVACDDDFKAGRATHIDLWIGGNTNDGPNHLLCEQTFGSVADQTIIQGPPSTLPVDPGQLWDGSACHDANSAEPFVYLNPSTSGLCAGGGNGGGTGGGSGGGNGGSNGAGDSGGSQTPTPQNGTPAPQDDDPKDAPVSSPQVYQLAATLVVNNLSSSSSSSSSLSSASITPSVTPSSATTTSSQANPAPQVADCASGVGLLGSPCETFSDCAGDWTCMGAPKTCHDNRLD